MIARTDITGVVLAGGLGRRMSADGQGTDKGLQPFRGQPLVAQALARLQPQVGALLVNANQNQDAYRAFGWPVISDRLDGFAGPLAGLASAMACATTDWVLTVPCDSPFFPDDLAVRLAQGAQQAGAPVAVVQTDGQPQPVFLLARRTLLPDLEAFLATGRRRIDAWYAPLSPAIVAFSDEQAFRNLNTLDELRSLE
ncbi:MAG: molybdenum cofactor guanylyltransferase [Burkholderiales bacterium]|nr:molybdenum cofactor guanylyltransferase [Burkholderiales bacterium]